MMNQNTRNFWSLTQLPGAILKYVMLEKRTTYTFTMDRDDFLRCRKKPDLLWYTLARGGVKQADVVSSSSGEFTLRNIVWWGCPMYKAENEDEVISSVQKAKKKNAKTFGLLLEKSFYDECKKDPFIIDASLLEGGLFSFNLVYYNDSMCAYWYTQCDYKSFYFIDGALDISSANKVLTAGLNGAEAVALMLDDSSWNLTLKDKEYIGGWLALAGLRGPYSPKKEIKTYLVGFDGDAFSPAVRILAAIKNGTESKLPGKYKRTLDIARKMTENVSGQALEMYIQIHDMLCRKITYEINPRCEDNSSCVGALVNGKAKCDGYADAFYLCCSLKKLPVVCQAGKSKVKIQNRNEDGHMWNLICLNGTWRGVDVTWDDAGNDIVYDYFNVGLDVMRTSYSFYDIMLPANMAEETNPLERPVHEYHVSSEEEITSACRDMIYSGQERITLRCSERFFKKFSKNSEVLLRAMTRAGIRQCNTLQRDNIIIISNVVLAVEGANYEYTGEVSASDYNRSKRNNDSRSLLTRVLDAIKEFLNI